MPTNRDERAKRHRALKYAAWLVGAADFSRRASFIFRSGEYLERASSAR